jgi:methyltransferase (TIGR00027 family)
MKDERPSATALRVAQARAAHQLVDAPPRVFEDDLAPRILGGQAAVLRGRRQRSPFARRMRAFVVARSRMAEDELALAIERGARQYVVLGAGLDTFACRNPRPASELRVFEVDHPATQAWKQRLLTDAGLALPGSATLVPVNFEHQSWLEALESRGFRRDMPAHFSWLGVSMYLRPAQVEQTLAAIASLPVSSVVFDYLVPPSQLDPVHRAVLRVLSAIVSLVGEPLRSHFAPDAMRALLAAQGFAHVEDAGPDALNARFFSGRSDGLAVGTLGRITCARR